jgi:hypothetical protein
MTGTGTNPDRLMARATSTRIAWSESSLNPMWTRVPGGMIALAGSSSPISFHATPREQSASSALNAAAAS